MCRLPWRALSAVLLEFLACAAVSAQEQGGPRLLGFSVTEAESQLALEAEFAAGLEAANLPAWLEALSARPHHPGSPGSRLVAESIAARFRAWGFDTEIEVFYALMPIPVERTVEMLAPHAFRASLAEPDIAGHRPKHTDDSLPPYNAYSKDGDVTARAVYVNYGTAQDYELLARHGIDIEGRIVLRISGHSGYLLDHTHSCSSSPENENECGSPVDAIEPPVWTQPPSS